MKTVRDALAQYTNDFGHISIKRLAPRVEKAMWKTIDAMDIGCRCCCCKARKKQAMAAGIAVLTEETEQ